jgi:chromosome segregation protein
MLANLDDDGSVVTPDGLWLGPGWLRQPASGDQRSGLLQREQEIRELDEKLIADSKQIGETEERLAQARAELATWKNAQPRPTAQSTRCNASAPRSTAS